MKKRHTFILLSALAAACLTISSCSERTDYGIQQDIQEPYDEADSGASEGSEEGLSAGDAGGDLIRPGVTAETELLYASQFRIEQLSDGCSIVTVSGEETLLLPWDMEVPHYAASMQVIRIPAEHIYLAATSAADLFLRLGALSNIGYISTTMESQTEEKIREAMEDGSISYAGKYSAPDYELLYAGDCPLAIESTMILHTPEAAEKLEELGITVFTERSSYESHPLGRAEWIKLYGILTGRAEEAVRVFDGICADYELVTKRVGELLSKGFERPEVAYFYINSAGVVNIHKPGGYMSALIEAAGGDYFADPADLSQEELTNALSTMNIQMEDFYALARDADILIYNGNYEPGLYSLGQLTEKNGLLSEFNAFKTGDVWISEKNMFQQSGAAGEVVLELFDIISGAASGTEHRYFRKLAQ